jgi:hypothetical protein
MGRLPEFCYDSVANHSDRKSPLKAPSAAGARGETAFTLRLIVQLKTPEASEATRLALRRATIKKGNSIHAVWSR